MGFIERLRQKLEAEALTRQQRENALSVAKQAEEIVRLQTVKAERELHRQRREQAKIFRDQSGVASLMAELGKLLISQRIPGMSPPTTDSEGIRMDGPQPGLVPKGSVRLNKDPSDFAIGDFRPHEVDIDSVLDIAEWDKKMEMEMDGFVRSVSYKYLVVETNPDGAIKFYSSRCTRVSQPEWQKSKDVLDSALEKAFAFQRTHKENFQPPWKRKGYSVFDPNFHGPIGNG